jgi:hypothetical protein
MAVTGLALLLRAGNGTAEKPENWKWGAQPKARQADPHKSVEEKLARMIILRLIDASKCGRKVFNALVYLRIWTGRGHL